MALALSQPPEVILQASAVGIYGTSLTREFDEFSPPARGGADFLSEVTSAWEAAADEGFSGQRLVKLRIGVVLGNDGGAYPLMRLPYLLGAGGPIGSGRQWVPWIHLKDIVSLFDYALTHPDIRGPVNAVSPNPVTNEQFGRILCRVYRRPFWLPLPSAMLKTLLGERSMLLLDGQRRFPQRLCAPDSPLLIPNWNKRPLTCAMKNKGSKAQNPITWRFWAFLGAHCRIFVGVAEITVKKVLIFSKKRT
ncbi:hypothetical protein HMSSN036_76720 [Paenibacillus macerans]|nr:hypothetical protein HMSSN036_76720 [Paenibacillus macerans]